MSNKWRVFHRPINLKPLFATDIVKACVVLHNFVRDRDGYEFEDTLTITGMEDIVYNEDGRMLPGGQTAENIRRRLAEFFLSPEGELSWQMSKI